MSSDQIIKLAIADDHKIFRDGIKMALAGKEKFKEAVMLPDLTYSID